MLDEQTAASVHSAGGARSGGLATPAAASMFFGDRQDENNGMRYGDTGGASRFFYTAKASKKDRGEGNAHPTVKPVDLMRYLIRLVTPPNGLVLDPFAGSGTTGIAAKAEGMRCVLIEREPEYVQIIQRRLVA